LFHVERQHAMDLALGCSTWNRSGAIDPLILFLFHVEQLRRRLYDWDLVPRGTTSHEESISSKRDCDNSDTPIVPRGTSPEVAVSVLPGLV
jgi:hypothetical protein